MSVFSFYEDKQSKEEYLLRKNLTRKGLQSFRVEVPGGSHAQAWFPQIVGSNGDATCHDLVLQVLFNGVRLQ
jgi:hypothetical protein